MSTTTLSGNRIGTTEPVATGSAPVSGQEEGRPGPVPLMPVEEYLQLDGEAQLRVPGRRGLSQGDGHQVPFHRSTRSADVWGVPFCWVIDPVKRSAWEYHSAAEPVRVTSALHAGELSVSLDELFAALVTAS
jgi:hypothetical protein